MVMVLKKDFKQVYNQKLMSFYIKIQSIGSCLFVDKYFRLHRHHTLIYHRQLTDIPLALYPLIHQCSKYSVPVLKIQCSSHWPRVNRYWQQNMTQYHPICRLILDWQSTHMSTDCWPGIDQVSVNILANTTGWHSADITYSTQDPKFLSAKLLIVKNLATL